MAQYEGYMPYAYGSDSVEAVNEIFRKVYQYMAIGLILTAVTAYITASSTTAIRMLFTSQAPLIIIALAEVGLVIFLGAALNKLSAAAALMLFAAYSILNGITCSVILLVYTRASVYQAFFSTAGMFGAMSVYGLYTKRDLTSMGSFLRMGVWGLLIAMLINIFIGSSMLELTVSVLGIIIFLGLTAYDTAKIKEMASTAEWSDGSITGKIAVIGALSLYLDFINIFLYMLRLFGKHRD
ncbi:MAG: Bax inhibitor-1/YccA family protein [Synergistaceae bacterium]|nr:Bax inhibitor-1/YccA family protein [Synergistaceae bacterium]